MMNRIIFRLAWIGVFWVASLACSFGQPASEPTSTPNTTSAPSHTAVTGCEQNGSPTEQDTQDALNYTGAAFSASNWQRSYTVLSDRVTVTWENEAEGALGYLENLVYPCGYTQTDVEAFFSEQSLKENILQNYERPELISSCSNNKAKLDLYEMTAWLHNQTYLVRIWVTQPSSTRMVYVLLTFPESGVDSFEQAAQNLYPHLPVCLQ